MTDTQRRNAYKTLWTHEVCGPAARIVLADLIGIAQGTKDPVLRCGQWDVIGHLLESLQGDPVPDEGAA